MGSKQKTDTKQKIDQTTTESRKFDPILQRQMGGLAGQLQNMFQQRTAQPLNLEFNKPFSDTPDPIVQNLLSRGVQNIKAQQSAADRSLADALSIAGTGANAAQIAGLRRAGAIQSAGAANALIPQAMEQQRGFDLQRQQISQAQNQQRLAARQLLTQELMPGLSLLDQLRQQALATSERSVRQQGVTKGKSRTTRSFF